VKALNEEFLAGNTCFGCGLDNPEGLHIKIFRESDDALSGTFTPRDTQAGFPHIVHGGVQFTALDCMAGWCCLILRAQGQKAVPLTKSASMRYLRPVRIGASYLLRADIVEGLKIKTAILDQERHVLSEAEFDYMLMPQERFKKAVGIDEMPEGYRRHFGEL
jgi:acyl-coenzyme A thioesterase PaaI-like protein